MNKTELKKVLIEIQNKSISSLTEKIDTTHSMVDVDEADTVDPEDLSHQSESMESEHLFRNQLSKAKADLNLIEQIDFSPKSKVEPGAFIKTEKFNFIVACATTPFDYNGMHITGISVESPIYKEMKGLESNSTFSLSGNNYKIIEIH
jgi:hypothetical protein